MDTEGNPVREADGKALHEAMPISIPDKNPDAKISPSLCLIREETGEVFDLDGDLTIGRDMDNDIVIPNPEGHYVSAHHAHIEVQGKDVYLKDGYTEIDENGKPEIVSSTNGTYVNDRKIRSCRIRAGNKIEFADIVFRVESTSATP